MKKCLKRAILGTVLSILCIGVSYASWDITFRPGLAFYGDAVGYNFVLGTQIDMSTLQKNFAAPGLTIGAGFHFNGGGMTAANIFNYAMEVDGGYKINLQFSPTFEMSIYPSIGFGWSLTRFEGVDLGYTMKSGLFLIPRVEINLPLSQFLKGLSIPMVNKVGIEFGMPMYISTAFVNNMYFGLVLTWELI